MKWIRSAILWGAGLAALPVLSAQTGVIIPSDKQSPDPRVLSIQSLNVRIVIDNGRALVHLDEVFHNETGGVLEGTYWLALPGDAAVSDFALWDDLTRIPGVILERKRAGELYNEIRMQTLDPALLESGEVAESNAPGEARHSSAFSVKIVPIPAYGYKRLEAEYRQSVSLDALASEFILPLKSSADVAPVVPRISISFELKSPQTIQDFAQTSQALPLAIGTKTDHLVSASYIGENVTLDRDLAIRFRLANDPSPGVTAYRSGANGENGFFEASTIIQGGKSSEKVRAPHVVLVLFDASLSMQWDKLEKSFQALESTLRALHPPDRFNVLVFNSDVSAALKAPVEATPDAIAGALDFVRRSPLRGGTNLQKVFASALGQSDRDTTIVLLSDGGATEGTVAPNALSSSFDRAWKALPEATRPHMFALAIGDDANTRLLKRIASHAGVFEQIGSTEPLEFKLAAFVRKIGVTPVDQIGLNVAASAGPRLVYRSGDNNFPGARAAWVGQYTHPGTAKFTVRTATEAGHKDASSTVRLPERDLEHAELPAAWARARVDALLDKIDREGEDAASINEIILLSRRYRFVTPYTSFLAAPRALLRPRLIRPGDPVLRVRTDPSVVSVIALFPFGLVQPLHHLASEDIWQTRFLAPADMTDGTYSVRLILRDRAGRVSREAKSFVISSHPPLVRVRLDTSRVHPGNQVPLRVQASATTRTISARLYGAEPVFLHWDESKKASTGLLNVPPSLPPGRYSIHVTAEDVAHNVSREEVPIEVLP